MKKTTSILSVICCVGSWLAAQQSVLAISGDYLEVRSCDVYTGPCFANAEMGLTGKEGILVWSIRQGSWNGVDLSNLQVIAVVTTDATLGDLRYEPRSGKAIVIVDSKADTTQKDALLSFVTSQAGGLIRQVLEIKSATIESSLGSCAKLGCAQVHAGRLVEISTRCLEAKDEICGNEETFYPPLTKVDQAYPVVTQVASFTGKGLQRVWRLVNQRSAFLAKFEY